MLSILYAIISVCFFLFWAKRSKLREYYSSLLCISYLRFLEQYILVYILKVWEYKDLPTPLAQIIGVPILLDVTLFPMLGYLMIHYSYRKFSNTVKSHLIWATAILFVECTMLGAGHLEHHRYWNFMLSYLLALATVIIIYLQYKLFLRTGWYTDRS
ncbi:CBO0543 family protein [Ammoniphilus sp. YIM 78166]|uniref:CBO0543 family protein n=1 Tax=Ammoniphilus sp. YIM 78166 TaxID=1644106 RepID=UPI00106FCB98|nr:CBO0543 family protein [Ammoniphilus sp. YIM 78166]